MMKIDGKPSHRRGPSAGAETGGRDFQHWWIPFIDLPLDREPVIFHKREFFHFNVRNLGLWRALSAPMEELVHLFRRALNMDENASVRKVLHGTGQIQPKGLLGSTFSIPNALYSAGCPDPAMGDAWVLHG